MVGPRGRQGRAIDAAKPLHIIYISDFDPGGRSMPVAVARKIEFTVRSAEIDIPLTLQPLALTPEQVARFRLPRVPMKEGERRADRFEARFGEGAVELDALEALHPGELAGLVEQEVGRYLDPTLAERVYAAERECDRDLELIRERVLARFDTYAIRDRFDAIRDDLDDLETAAASTWADITEALYAEKPLIGPDDVPMPRFADPVEEPLFDSRRDSLTDRCLPRLAGPGRLGMITLDEDAVAAALGGEASGGVL